MRVIRVDRGIRSHLEITDGVESEPTRCWSDDVSVPRLGVALPLAIHEVSYVPRPAPEGYVSFVPVVLPPVADRRHVGGAQRDDARTRSVARGSRARPRVSGLTHTNASPRIPPRLPPTFWSPLLTGRAGETTVHARYRPAVGAFIEFVRAYGDTVDCAADCEYWLVFYMNTKYTTGAASKS